MEFMAGRTALTRFEPDLGCFHFSDDSEGNVRVAFLALETLPKPRPHMLDAM